MSDDQVRDEIFNVVWKACDTFRGTGAGSEPETQGLMQLTSDVHPFFVAAQYHPEFKSRPERPAPLFREFVAAAFAARGGEAREDAADDAHASRRTG